MSFSPKEYRAIYFVAHQRGWKVAMCRKPIIRYQVGDQFVSVRLPSILRAYDKHLKRKTYEPDYSLSTKTG